MSIVGQLGCTTRNSRSSAPAQHPYFPQRASVVAAVPALQSSAIPAKITFGLNSKQHSVRLETAVTSRKQTREVRSNRYSMVQPEARARREGTGIANTLRSTGFTTHSGARSGI